MINHTKIPSKDGDKSSGLRRLFGLNNRKSVLPGALLAIQPVISVALGSTRIAVTPQVEDIVNLVPKLNIEDEVSLEEFHTKLKQDREDQRVQDNKKLPAKVVGDALFDAGINVIAAKEAIKPALSVIKQVPGVNDTLNQMIRLTSQVGEIGKTVPLIAPVFKILEVRIHTVMCYLCSFFSS